jgi:hypothetical protein
MSVFDLKKGFVMEPKPGVHLRYRDIIKPFSIDHTGTLSANEIARQFHLQYLPSVILDRSFLQVEAENGVFGVRVGEEYIVPIISEGEGSCLTGLRAQVLIKGNTRG